MSNQIAAKGIVAAAQVFIGLLLMVSMTGTRRDTFFGVRVPAGFPTSPEGRRAVVIFRTTLGIVLLLSLIAILLASGEQFPVVLIVAPLSTVCAAVVGFVLQNRRLRPFSVPPVQTREAELSTEPEKSPWFLWLWPGPLIALAAAAAYLHAHWDRILATFPVHWGIDGEPNRWSHRTVGGVYFPVILGAQIVAWLAVLALASWYGARRSSLRRAITGVAVASEYFLGSIMVGVAISPLVRIGPKLVLALTLPMVLLGLGSVIYLVRMANQPRNPPDPTPDECWKGGMLYYNPNDAALMVERRDSVGLTINFGHPWSWALVGFMVVNMAVVLFGISRS